MQRLFFYAFRTSFALFLLFVLSWYTSPATYHNLVLFIAPNLVTWIGRQSWDFQTISIALTIAVMGLISVLCWIVLQVNIDHVSSVVWPLYERCRAIKWQRVCKIALATTPVIYGLLILATEVLYYTGHQPLSLVLFNISDDFKYFALIVGVVYIALKRNK